MAAWSLESTLGGQPARPTHVSSKAGTPSSRSCFFSFYFFFSMIFYQVMFYLLPTPSYGGFPAKVEVPVKLVSRADPAAMIQDT